MTSMKDAILLGRYCESNPHTLYDFYYECFRLADLSMAITFHERK